MAKKKTDRQRKKIIADYVECENYSEAARRNGVSRNTVKAIVMSDPELSKKCQQKKDENTTDVLNYMSSKGGAVCKLMDVYLDLLVDPEKLRRANIIQIATALGIVIDKFTAVSKDDRALEKLTELMDKVGGVI